MRFTYYSIYAYQFGVHEWLSVCIVIEGYLKCNFVSMKRVHANSNSEIPYFVSAVLNHCIYYHDQCIAICIDHYRRMLTNICM